MLSFKKCKLCLIVPQTCINIIVQPVPRDTSHMTCIENMIYGVSGWNIWTVSAGNVTIDILAYQPAYQLRLIRILCQVFVVQQRIQNISYCLRLRIQGEEAHIKTGSRLCWKVDFLLHNPYQDVMFIQEMEFGIKIAVLWKHESHP